LRDPCVEADEADQNAGEKGEPHDDPEDPPRRRANKVRGHGTMANDRPPIVGVVGRESGEARLDVVENSDQETLGAFVVANPKPGTLANTDEWSGYDRLPKLGRGRVSVCHAPGKREWARDDDGDGVREVHNNPMEGLWTGVRNFLRPFRGVHKWYLRQYVAMCEWGYNVKAVTMDFLRVRLGVQVITNLGP
jgi:transposase